MIPFASCRGDGVVGVVCDRVLCGRIKRGIDYMEIKTEGGRRDEKDMGR